MNLQILRTKKYLTNALLDLMKTTPFSKISVKDITDKAMLSRTAFYSHYNSKEDILYERAAELYVNQIRISLNAQNKTQYENWVVGMKQYWSNKEFYQLLHKNNLDYIVYDVQMDNYGQMIDLINKTVPAHIQDEQLYSTIYAPYHRRADNYLIMDWLSSEKPITPEEMASLVCAFSSLSVYETFRNDYYQNLQRTKQQ